MKPYHLNLFFSITLTALSALNAGRGNIGWAAAEAMLAFLNFVVYIGKRAADVDKKV